MVIVFNQFHLFCTGKSNYTPHGYIGKHSSVDPILGSGQICYDLTFYSTFCLKLNLLFTSDTTYWVNYSPTSGKSSSTI